MNKAQQNACKTLWLSECNRIHSNLTGYGVVYRSDSNGYGDAVLPTYRRFRKRFTSYPSMVPPKEHPMYGGIVKGMFFGIEADGYTHT
jgi:hypothetical protein